MRERKQKHGESIQDYVLALRTIAQKCVFTATEINTQVKDQFISDVRNKRVRYALLKESSSNLDNLIKLAKTVELADSKAEGFGIQSKPSDAQLSSEESVDMHSIKY